MKRALWITWLRLIHFFPHCTHENHVLRRHMDLTSQKDVCSPAMFLGGTMYSENSSSIHFEKKTEAELLGVYRDEIKKTTVILLMEEILHELVSSLSHYLQGLYTPGGAGFLQSIVAPPKKTKNITILFRQSFKLYSYIHIPHIYIYIHIQDKTLN